VTSGIPLGPYLLGRRLAVGGMAEIFLARCRDPGGLSGELVVKRILPHLAQDPQFSQMFFEEARIVSHLNHPNVVRFYDFGQADGSFYLAMELVRGVDLGDLIARATRRRAMRGQTYALAPPHVAKILSGVCEGLAHAHALVVNGENVGLVHRDITPANILLGFEGSVKIADFGVAKLARGAQRDATRVGRVRGKYAYLSPEQARGERLDARSDVFNVGILLFEATLGEDLYPHDDKDKARLLAAAGRIPDAERIARMPARLADITRWALSPRRQDRAGSALELRDALDEYVRGAGVPTGPSVIGSQVRQLFPDRVAADARMPQAAGTGPHAALSTAPLTDPADGRVETPALGLPTTPPVVFSGLPAVSQGAGPPAPARALPPGPVPAATASDPWPGESALPTQVVPRPRRKKQRVRLGRTGGLLLVAMAAAAFGLAAFAFSSPDDGPPRPLARPILPARPPPRVATPPAPFELRLRAEPAGLSLRLDGRTLGPAPQLASTTPNTDHLVEALNHGEVVASQQIRGEPGQVRELVLRAPPDEAAVRVVSTPIGANARVDGQEVGVTPVTLTLASGVHRLELRADGYELLSTQLEAVAGRAGTVALALAQESQASQRITRQRTGVLSVRLRPHHGRTRDASVSIDGERPRALPLSGLRLPPGRHELTLEVDGRAPRQHRFRIRARHHTRLRY